jgi:hypothetical protein
MRIIYFIRRFWEIPNKEIYLLFRVLILCLLIIPLVYIVPFKHYCKILKFKKKTNNLLLDDNVQIYLIKKTILRIQRFLPFKLKCLAKSTILKLMLNYYGVKSSIVLAANINDSQSISAHAFIKIENNLSIFRRTNFVEILSLE